MRMRIGLAHKRLDLNGGTERDLYLTAVGLKELGHEVHLFCGEYGVDPPAGTFGHRVPVVPLGRTARLWSYSFSAPKIIRKHRCDVVVSFGRMVRQDVLRSGGGSHRVFLEKLVKESGIWRRVWQTVSLYHRSLLVVERQQFSDGHFKKVLAVSEQVKREIVATYAVSEDKIMVLYNGVDPKRFHPSLQAKWRPSIRQQWGIPLDAWVVLFVGNGFQRKGLNRLITAWGSPRLREVYLLVVGDDARSRRYRARAEAEANGHVLFAGRQEAVERYYAAANVVALPAVQEAFGNVVLEALASGLPVVVSRVVGACEVLKGGLAEGIIDRPEDASEIADRLVRALERSRQPVCGIEARLVGEEHSWKNHFRKLEDCLIEVSRQPDGGSLI